MVFGGEGFAYGAAAGPTGTVKGYPGYMTTYNGQKDAFSARPMNQGMFFMSGQRRRMNVVAVLISLFLPWLLFCATSGLVTSLLHYKYPGFAWLLVFVLFLAVVCSSGYLASKARIQRSTEASYQPSWYIFIFATCLVAFVLGVVAGEWNFTSHMEPYYNLKSLAEYKDINTNDYVGQQLMDAGSIDFKKGTVLDLGRSMGFKNHDTYCVAPIITGGGAAGAQSVDFWAVGKNCCSGVSADFHCSGFSDPQNTGVIRLMHDEDRPFYRLAVQQAEATYHLTASHPLFFQWVRNADEATNNYAHQGYYNYFLFIAAYFLLQIFLTAVSALAFAKLIHA